CQPGGDKDCNDHSDCTIDSCMRETGCVHTPVDEPCCDRDDQCKGTDFCSINVRCVDTHCVSDRRTCDDNNPCTIDTCTSEQGGFECENKLCYEVDPSLCPPIVPSCIPPECGNKIVKTELGETCDPPGKTMPNGSVCRADCTYCGDKLVNGSEACDDGNSEQ